MDLSMRIFFCNNATGEIDRVVTAGDYNDPGAVDIYSAEVLAQYTPVCGPDSMTEDRIIMEFDPAANRWFPKTSRNSGSLPQTIL